MPGKPAAKPSAPAKETWTYDGPVASVEVRLPSGRWIKADRGDTVTLLANEARAVASLPGWTPAATVKE